MLIHLLAHRALPKALISRTSYPLEKLQEMMLSIGKESIILPGEPIPPRNKVYAFTFDDATFDFYHFLYPWLIKEKIRVSLSIPTFFIQDSVNMPCNKRLEIAPFRSKEAHCSWKEISEMVQSGYVLPLSHSHSHTPLTLQNCHRELLLSRDILEEKCKKPIDSFVYPFGKATKAVVQESKKYYKHLFRIGSAINFSWGNKNGLSYRIPIENYPLKTFNPAFKWLTSSLLGR